MDYASSHFSYYSNSEVLISPILREQFVRVEDSPFDFAALFAENPGHTQFLPSVLFSCSPPVTSVSTRDVTQRIVYEPHFNTIVWETYARTKRGEEMSRHILGTPRTIYVSTTGLTWLSLSTAASTLIRRAVFVSMPKDKQFPFLAVRNYLSSTRWRYNFITIFAVKRAFT